MEVVYAIEYKEACITDTLHWLLVISLSLNLKCFCLASNNRNYRLTGIANVKDVVINISDSARDLDRKHDSTYKHSTSVYEQRLTHLQFERQINGANSSKFN